MAWWGAVIALCLMVSVFGQDPSVSIDESEPQSFSSGLLEARRDSDVTLDCYVENLPEDIMVRWQKSQMVNGRLEIQKISDDAAIEDNTKHSIEKPTPFTWRLRIKNIQLSDQATYLCFVQVTLKNRVEASRTIQVLVPPVMDLEKTSPDLTEDEGASAELFCNASGIPAPSVEWSRIGGALLPNGKERHLGAILPLTNIQAKDRGVYRCVVQNRVGKMTRDITVTVRFKPIITTVSKVVKQKPGCQIELQCFVTAFPYPSGGSKSWIMDATSFSQSTGRYTVRSVEGAFNQLTYEMIISSVQPEDYGIYQCQIKNSQGTTSSTILLQESDEAQPSVKFNRVMCGACAVQMSVLLTAASTLAVTLFLLHR